MSDSTSTAVISRRRALGLGVASLATIAGVTSIARSAAHDGHEHDADATPQASPAASPAASPLAEVATVSVATVDLGFKPNTLTIPAKTDVQVVVTNNGKMPHDFVIGQLNLTSGLILPGESSTLVVNAAAGNYQYICSIPGHKQAGMVGTLTAE